MPVEPMRPAGPGSWRVSPGMILLKLGAAGILAVVALAGLARGDTGLWVVAGAAAVGLAVSGARDLLVRVRVEADTAGVTIVAGFGRRIRFAWPQIERVRVDARSRHGLRAVYLEIDAGDSVHLFSANELSAPVAEVAEALNALRSESRPSGPA
jgi:hypothetical protein